MKVRGIAVAFVVALGMAEATAAAAGPIFDAFPAKPDKALRYVVYLHGRIVEEQGRRAMSPDFGPYRYDEILAALASGGAVVIGEVRQKGADVDQAAAHVVESVRDLLAAGVPAGNVTVIGASKGSGIAQRASTALDDREIGWVIMAGCGDEAPPGISLHGHVLSIYETSDEMGTCAPLFAKSKDMTVHDEVKLETGLGHGFIYKPLPEWVRPAMQWIERRKIDR